ncbi:Retrovirus-related Pol polyprotein from type-2 retrotransposable element R2DM, partial [Araneus ventricosus]
EVRPSILQEL